MQTWRRRLMVVAIVGAAGPAIHCAKQGQNAPARKRPKNFILISMDTVRADHLSTYGYNRNTTPRIDKYASRGVVFEHCTSSSSWTVPAHHTIFTSMEPATHGCVYYPKPGRLNREFDTMAKIFTRHGFRTAAFTGGGYVGKRMGFDVGFEHFESLGVRFERNMDATLEWLDANNDKPFFLFMHGFNAHRPYVPPPPYKYLFAGDYQGNYDIKQFAPGKPKPEPDDLAYVVSQYDGEIAFIDAMMGDFFLMLRERNLLADTLVILTSDHGDEFYEHGRCDHIHTLYDELTAVPWIMFGPGIPAKRVRDHVGTIDILPTVLSMFGIEESIAFQGADRSSLIFEDHGPRDAAIYSFTGKSGRPKHLSSVRTSRWKLVTDLPAGGPNPACPRCKQQQPEGGDVALYDLQADPTEQRDVSEENADVVAYLKNKLEERIAKCRALRLTTESPPPAGEEYLETLRTLGYIDGD